MRKLDNIPIVPLAVLTPAALFILINHWLLLVSVIVMTMNAEWKHDGKNHTHRLLFGFIVAFLGCIPYNAINAMPLGTLGLLLFAALSAMFFAFLGKDKENAQSRATDPYAANSGPSTSTAVSTFRNNNTNAGVVEGAAILVNGRWVPVDNFK